MSQWMYISLSIFFLVLGPFIGFTIRAAAQRSRGRR